MSEISAQDKPHPHDDNYIHTETWHDEDGLLWIRMAPCCRAEVMAIIRGEQ